MSTCCDRCWSSSCHTAPCTWRHRSWARTTSAGCTADTTAASPAAQPGRLRQFRIVLHQGLYRLAAAPYFIKLDADVTLLDDWIEYVEACIAAHPHAVLMGPWKGDVDIDVELSGAHHPAASAPGRAGQRAARKSSADSVSPGRRSSRSGSGCSTSSMKACCPGRGAAAGARGLKNTRAQGAGGAHHGSAAALESAAARAARTRFAVFSSTLLARRIGCASSTAGGRIRLNRRGEFLHGLEASRGLLVSYATRARQSSSRAANLRPLDRYPVCAASTSGRLDGQRDDRRQPDRRVLPSVDHVLRRRDGEGDARARAAGYQGDGHCRPWGGTTRHGRQVFEINPDNRRPPRQPRRSTRRCGSGRRNARASAADFNERLYGLGAGCQALHAAILLGGSPIFLLGYDFYEDRGSHFDDLDAARNSQNLYPHVVSLHRPPRTRNVAPGHLQLQPRVEAEMLPVHELRRGLADNLVHSKQLDSRSPQRCLASCTSSQTY